MNSVRDLPHSSIDHEDSNPSNNPSFDSILAARLSMRLGFHVVLRPAIFVSV